MSAACSLEGSLRGRERRTGVVSAQRTGDVCREKDRMEVRRERLGEKRSRWMVMRKDDASTPTKSGSRLI